MILEDGRPAGITINAEVDIFDASINNDAQNACKPCQCRPLPRSHLDAKKANRSHIFVQNGSILRTTAWLMMNSFQASRVHMRQALHLQRQQACLVLRLKTSYLSTHISRQRIGTRLAGALSLHERSQQYLTPYVIILWTKVKDGATMILLK